MWLILFQYSQYCNTAISFAWNWTHKVSKVRLDTSQPLSPDTPTIAQWAHEQSGHGGRMVIHGLRNTKFCPRWRNWLQPLLSDQYASSRDQQWVPNMAPFPRVIGQATQCQVDYSELLPSWKGKSFILTRLDILGRDLPLLYPMFLPNLPLGHLGLFHPLH